MALDKIRYQKLHKMLRAGIPAGRIFEDALHMLAFATDASFYRLIPRLVVRALKPEEVAFILKCCRAEKIPFTFRAAGTSLSGQALSDSVLILVNSGWKQVEVLDGGKRIRLGPGITGGEANRILKPYGRRIGPDPASIDSAMIGGIAANNASGICCGVAQNTYHTLDSLKMLLPDGTRLDTASEPSRQDFERSHPAAFKLRELGHAVKQDSALTEKIRAKYRIKNTTGYSLNALVDYEHPADILAHLLVGSEGTLGFIEEITLVTVSEPAWKAAAFVLFPDLSSACRAVQSLEENRVSAAELLDDASLAAVKPLWAAVTAGPFEKGMAALLLECAGENLAELERNIAEVCVCLGQEQGAGPVAFTQDPEQIRRFWAIRKGLFPAVGGVRPSGESVIIEDVCFPREKLAEGAEALRLLLDRYGYARSVIFGHVLAGNLHFVFTQDFSADGEVERYGAFLSDLTDLVSDRFGGSLKAEHGTGRNMAPFVEKEWGQAAYRVMQQIKTILDPDGLFNPGVILNADQKSHLKNLKPLPPADSTIDACTECGFCEKVCPSREFTLTPRQRIAVFREMESLRRSGRDGARRRELEKAFRFQGDESCAADGVCAAACPLGIDTGQLIKKIRAKRAGRFQQAAGLFFARHFAVALMAAKFLLRVARLAETFTGAENLERVSAWLNRVSGGLIPAWYRQIPRTGKLRLQSGAPGREPLIYFPSCLARTFCGKREDGSQSLADSAHSLLEKSGQQVLYLPRTESLCCGLVFESKGLQEAAAWKLRELQETLWQASGEGALAVFSDTSPCTQRLKQALQGTGMNILDPAEWMIQRKDLFAPCGKKEALVLHTPCSAQKGGLETQYRQAASLLAERVIESGVACCGFAGDKGLRVPGLSLAALEGLRAEADGIQGCSASILCEAALERRAGARYDSLIQLADEALK